MASTTFFWVHLFIIKSSLSLLASVPTVAFQLFCFQSPFPITFWMILKELSVWRLSRTPQDFRRDTESMNFLHKVPCCPWLSRRLTLASILSLGKINTSFHVHGTKWISQNKSCYFTVPSHHVLSCTFVWIGYICICLRRSLLSLLQAITHSHLQRKLRLISPMPLTPGVIGQWIASPLSGYAWLFSHEFHCTLVFACACHPVCWLARV